MHVEDVSYFFFLSCESEEEYLNGCRIICSCSGTREHTHAYVYVDVADITSVSKHVMNFLLCTM